MKRIRIRIVVLSVVFVASLFFFYAILNRDNTDMAVNMGEPTLPTISFRVGNQDVNLLPGHMEELPISIVRNVVTPLDAAGAVTLNLQKYGRKISALSYVVYARDGQSVVLERTEKQPKESLNLLLGEALGEAGDGFLRIKLELDQDQTLFYHTRIVNKPEAGLESCMDYIRILHEAMLYGENTDVIEEVLETETQGDQTLQHVTIHSKLEHATWGKLSPKVVGKVNCQVQETSEAYTSVQLRYRVTCGTEENLYEVREFFKVRCAGEKRYLLAYDRVMTQRFGSSQEVLSGKGIDLGMVSREMQYKTNADGTVVAFVQANELWSYCETENEFALIFSFADSTKEDVRNYFSDHSLKVLSVGQEGNITFAVYGYMNRGRHEGKSGAALYYFDIEKNVVHEVAFIPSNQPYAYLEEELGRLAYYHHEANVLYMVADESLYEIQLETGEQKVLLEHLEQENYVSSEEGRYLAYQETEGAGTVTVLDFETGETRSVQSADEKIQPLGFIRGDFVYGVAREADSGRTVSGENVLGMYKVEIMDEKNQILKTYQAEGTYVLGAEFDANRIRLQCAKKMNGIYQEIEEDYISNNEERVGNISLKSYWDETKGTLYRLHFEDGLKKREARVLKPKQVLVYRDNIVKREETLSEERYIVYGFGDILGSYSQAGEAVAQAKEVSGIVVSEKQLYIWEADNRVAWYRNFDIPSFRAESQETTLAACERVASAYRESEKVRIAGCSVAELRYLIDKGTAVVALMGSSEAVMLVGYDARTVTYIDPQNGGIYSMSFSKFNDMVRSSGQTYYAYMNK